MNTLAQSRLQEFTDLVRLGEQSFVRAGEVLCELVNEDPRACDRLLEMKGHRLTRPVLEKFLAMGQHRLHPTLVMHDTPASQRLALLPYEEQDRLFNARVMVVTRDGEVEKRVCDLNAREASRVIGEGGIRTPVEQRRLLRPHGAGGRGYSAPRSSSLPRDVQFATATEEAEPPCDGPHHALFNPAPALSPAGVQRVPVEVGSDHAANLVAWLDAAQQALLEARSSLTMIHQHDHPKDRHIEVALRELGLLKFAAKQGEL